jgi:hypothetical protein
MNQVKPIDPKTWLRNSLRAYFEGEKDLHWISRAVRGSERATIILLLTTFGRYSGTDRYAELQWVLRDYLEFSC